jgi:F0F1-type ATP synthase alpha subunit
MAKRCQAGELIDLGQGKFGLALNLDKASVSLVVLGNNKDLKWVIQLEELAEFCLSA